jgi:hypothetical protein
MNSRNPVQTTAIACAAMALSAAVTSAALGHARPGLALAAGIVIGSANGYLARRALGSGISFRATSIARLAVLSAAGLAVGLLIGIDVAWLTLLGLAVAQLVLALVAARGLVGR